MVENDNNKTVQNGNGVNTSFSFTFQVSETDGSDIEIYITDTSGNTGEALSSGYLITLNDPADLTAGGYVTYPYPTSGTKLQTGEKITIARIIPITSDLDLENTGPFIAQNVEDAIDKVTMIAQQINEALSRTLKADISVTSGANYQLSSPVAGKVVGWDATATKFYNYDNPAAAQIAAAASAAAAAESENLAEKWASEEEDTEVITGKYSSFHWAQKAEDQASEASTSATNAASSAIGAASSATAAETAATTATNQAEMALNIASGSPKGVYNTLSDLETAFPTGTTGIYVIVADGKWYYWDDNTSAWIAGGTYQATGIADNSIEEVKIIANTFAKFKSNINKLCGGIRSIDDNYIGINGSFSREDFIQTVDVTNLLNYDTKQAAQLKFNDTQGTLPYYIKLAKTQSTEMILLSDLGIAQGNTVTIGMLVQKITADLVNFVFYINQYNGGSYISSTASSATSGTSLFFLRKTINLNSSCDRIAIYLDLGVAKLATDSLFNIAGWYLIDGSDVANYYYNDADYPIDGAYAVDSSFGINSITKGVLQKDFSNLLRNTVKAIHCNNINVYGGGTYVINKNDADFLDYGIEEYLTFVFDGTQQLQFEFYEYTAMVKETAALAIHLDDYGISYGSTLYYGATTRVTDGKNYRLYLNQYNASAAYISGTSQYIQFSGTGNIQQISKSVTLHADCRQLRIIIATDTVREGLLDITNIFINTQQTYALLKLNNDGYNGYAKWYGKIWSDIGDSIVAPGMYARYVQRKLGFETLINYGISGARIANLAVDDGYNSITVVNRWETFNTAVDLATICAGINDYHAGIPLGNIESSTSNTEFYGAYKTVIEGLLTANPSMRLVLETPMQKYDSSTYNGENPNAVGLKPIDYRNAVINLSEKYGIPCNDMFIKSGFNKFTVGTYTIDGLHPNDAGRVRMAEVKTRFYMTI
jgi:lysophospholipase L1-like esterase